MKKKLWDIRRYLVELKIGIFFIAALLLFYTALMSIKDITYFRGTYVIGVKFNFAEGLRPSSPVRFAGVRVGEVKDVEIKQEPSGKRKVYVYAKVQNNIKIPRNSQFFVNSLSIFGEKYLEIIPPASSQETYLKKGDIVEGISPVPLFHIFVKFDETLKEVRDFIREGDIKTSFEKTIANIEKISLDLKDIVSSMKDKKGTIGKLLYDDAIYTTAEELLLDLKNHPWKLLYKPKEKMPR